MFTFPRSLRIHTLSYSIYTLRSFSNRSKFYKPFTTTYFDLYSGHESLKHFFIKTGWRSDQRILQPETVNRCPFETLSIWLFRVQLVTPSVLLPRFSTDVGLGVIHTLQFNIPFFLNSNVYTNSKDSLTGILPSKKTK